MFGFVFQQVLKLLFATPSVDLLFSYFYVLKYR